MKSEDIHGDPAKDESGLAEVAAAREAEQERRETEAAQVRQRYDDAAARHQAAETAHFNNRDPRETDRLEREFREAESEERAAYAALMNLED